MTSIDEKIAALKISIKRAEDACHTGEVEIWRFEIAALEHARDDEAARMHRRQLSRDYARCVWSGDVDGAAVIQAEIDRIERGQP